MAFSFPQKPAGTPAFGQASSFGTPQQSGALPFGTTAAGAGAQPQFGGGGAFQFSNTAAPTPPTGFGFSAAPNMTAPAYNFSTPQKSAFGTPVAAPAPTFGAAAAAPAPAFGAAASMPAFGAAAPTPAFGAAAPTPAFGAAAAAPMPAFGAAAAAPTPAFGAAAAAPMPAFGAAQPTQSLFGTHAPSSAQASTGFGLGSTAPTGGGLTFGTPVTSAPLGFGATTSGGSTAFGTPAPTLPPTFGGFGTATPAAPTFGALGGFGAGPASSTPGGGYSIGATAPASLTPGTGLTFGAPAAVSSAPSLTGFGLGAAPASTPSTGLTFGTPSASSAPGVGLTSAPTTGLTFNTPASSQAPATALTFGTPASSAPATVGLNFPVSSAAPAKALAFGTPASTAGLQFGAATTASTLAATAPASNATGLSFAAGTTGAGSALFGLGSTAAASTATSLSTGLSFGLGSTTIKPLTTTATTTGFALGLAPPAITSTATALSAAPVGLGGITEAKTPTTTSAGQPEVPPRDQPLPNELQQAVEEFKKYIKAQKQYSSDISRFSVKDLKSVATDIDLVGKKLVEMENELKKNSAVAQQLKVDMAKGLQHMELAQRTFDTPNALQYDNNAPLNYFVELADGFERDMFSVRAQIENVDKYLKNLSNPATLTSNDLSIGLRRLHETFVTLAGQLQLVHNRVSIQKQQYLDLRKRALNDPTDVFEDKAKPKVDPFEAEFQDVYRPPAVSVGPTPFSSFGSSQAQAVAQNAPPPYARVQAPASSALPSAVPLFGNSTFNLSFQPSTNTSSQSSFQLQKPPIGNKRGRN